MWYLCLLLFVVQILWWVRHIYIVPTLSVLNLLAAVLYYAVLVWSLSSFFIFEAREAKAVFTNTWRDRLKTEEIQFHPLLLNAFMNFTAFLTKGLMPLWLSNIFFIYEKWKSQKRPHPKISLDWIRIFSLNSICIFSTLFNL